MKTIYKLFFLVICLGLSNSVYAQQGTIRGTVIEQETGDPIFGVTVQIPGTSIGTSTDLDGQFDFNVASGTYTLQISYISYRTLTIEGVVVEAGEVTVLDNIRMEQSVELLDEVVVSAEAITNSEAAIITRKRRSPNLIDGISAQAFSQSGVSDAGEALTKVTGVSIEGGKYVFVRGVGDRYTKTMLNSVEIPSLDPDKNSLQIDIFPTNLINNMVITKSAVAEMPADFTGGIVNIETINFPERPIYGFSLSMGYNPSMHFNRDFLSYGGSNTDILGFDSGVRQLPNGARGQDIPTAADAVSSTSGITGQDVYNFVHSFSPNLGPRKDSNMMDYGLGFSFGNQYRVGNGGNNLGYIVSGTYKNSSSYYGDFNYGEYQIPPGSQNYELIYATKQNGSVAERNVLVGGLAGLAFKTNTSRYKLTALHLQNGVSRASNFIVDNSTTAPGQSGYFGDSYNLEYRERGITNAMLNGFHYFEGSDWELDWRVSATLSNMTDPDIRKTTYTLIEDQHEPIEQWDRTFNAGAGGFPSRQWRFMDEVNLVGRIDFTRTYELFGNVAEFKFGGGHIYKDRDYEILSYSLQFWGAQPDDWTGNPDEILSDENIFGNAGGDGSIYYQSGNPDPNPNAYSSNLHNTALYVANEFNISSNLKVYLGVRAENYVQRHTGRDLRYAQGDTTGGINLANKKVLDALDLFPSANLTFFLSDDMNLRASYSRTIARPSFKELSFAQIIDPVSDRIFNGGLYSIGTWDGNLVETRINNFDLRLERFFPSGQLFSLSLFYKTFDKPLELVRIRTSITSSEFQPRNVGDGQVYGLEFEVRRTLDFLSPSLRYFGFSGNLTLVKSKIEMTEDEYQARKGVEKDGQKVENTRQMAGQAPYMINAGITYDNVDSGFNGGFFYNITGETLDLVGGGAFPDVYSKPFHSLNFNLNKSFLGGRYSLSLNVTNILNDLNKKVYRGFRAEDQIYEAYTPHTSASLGFKYSF